MVNCPHTKTMMVCQSCKLLEYIILKQIYKLLEPGDFLVPSQYEFWEWFFTTRQLIETVNDPATIHNQKSQADVIFFRSRLIQCCTRNYTKSTLLVCSRTLAVWMCLISLPHSAVTQYLRGLCWDHCSFLCASVS